ncbi:MAG TPA: Mur ligase family protein [Candidatus Binataceae bacterium]|nr:Mur ligase family protein [Candidatus Binataceae bacterium]
MPDTESEARLACIPATLRHVHLIGVAGTAMAALAGMLVERGFHVSGSDNQFYEPTASLLRASRVELKAGFAGSNLAPAPDLVVVGNVIQRVNPEAQALLASTIPYLSMPEALWHFFLSDRKVLMVAGTHGKTTSTAMMAHVLASAGRDPSMLVGGVALDFDSNYRLGGGSYFVIEGDEYDTAFFDKGPKFLHYRAAGTIVTAVEFDHADIYRDLDHVKASFRALANQADQDRTLAVCADFPHALDAVKGSRAHSITFGLNRGQFRATDIRVGADGAHFDVVSEGKTVARAMHLPIGGRMNVANALGVLVLLCEFGLSVDEIARGLKSFKSVARRQQVLGEAAGVTVVDDFAHHPTAIRVTLQALGERFPGRRLLAAFEPRSNTARRNVFQKEFGDAFAGASRVYLGPVYFKDSDPIPPNERLDTAALVAAIAAHGATTFACASNEEILQRMLADCSAGDVAIFMSNGPFDGLKNRFLEALRGRGAS